MTENTQTRAERIDTLIGSNSIPMPNGWAQTSPDATQHVVEAIAAEIDAKDATIDRLQRELADSYLMLTSTNADLHRCESALRLALAGTDQNYFAIPARIEDVRLALAQTTEERDEMRGELAEARAYISAVIDAPGEGG